MKYFTFLVLALFISFSISAQKFTQKRADRKFEKEYYIDAIKLYSKVMKKNPYNGMAASRLADSYRLINDFKNAEYWYAKAVVLDSNEPLNYYYFAEALKNNQKYDSALYMMERYHQVKDQDMRALRHIENKSYVELLKADSAKFTLNYLSLNTDFTEFGVAFRNDKSVVFSAARQIENLKDKTHKRDNSPFLNLYSAELENWDLKNISMLGEGVNTPMHEGPVCFSKDGLTMFFTRNNYLKKSTKEGRVNRLKIYSAQFDGTSWINIKELPFNSNDYSCGHPALSVDGKTLYFVSDMPGGYGETDLYRVDFDGDNFSSPVNLGNQINTEGKEMFPFVSKKGELYFSSNGYATLGGLDVLVCAPTAEKQFGRPVNIGYPISSSADDFAFVLASDGFHGYFASNRRKSDNDDIYQFSITPKPPVAVPDYVEIDKNMDAFIFPLENDKMGDGKLLVMETYTQNTKSGGSVLFNPRSKGFEYKPATGFVGVDTIFYTIADTIQAYKGTSSSYVAIKVKDVYYGLVGLVVMKGSGKPVPGVKITLMENDVEIKTLETDSLGGFLVDLDKDKKYGVKLEKEGYLAKTVFVSTFNIQPGIQKIKEVIEIEEMKIGAKFAINIYFDTGKSNIRPDAAQELDEKVYTFLFNNPTVKIELSAHTDSRGTAASNEKLSQSRAESSVKYLIGRGIDPARLIAKGYGEYQLMNGCKDGVKCTEAEHQQNRRVEIKVLSY